MPVKTKADLKGKIQGLNWLEITHEMHHNGYAMVPSLISQVQCQGLIEMYNRPELFRKTITMERYRFGLGEYKYFSYPLPDLIQTIREDCYPYLASIANDWMKQLRLPKEFPARMEELLQLCQQKGQTKPTALILKYGKGGHNTLHQDLYGEIFFPIQAALFLNDPETEYQGGEFVLTQQTPRAQSKAVVLRPGRGDMLLFATSVRPVEGKRGYYRANMKHGVSEVHSGNRHTLGIIFHDALS